MYSKESLVVQRGSRRRIRDLVGEDSSVEVASTCAKVGAIF